MPKYTNYNLSIQHQVMPSTVLEVAYVGALARHLLGQFDENQPTVSARLADTIADVNYLRPYQGYGRINSRFPGYTNNYNSLQVSANHHSSRGLTLGVAYTWSKDLTTQSYDRDQGQASVLAAQAAQLSAEANLGVLNAQVKEAESLRAELQTSLDKANLDLSFTTVKAAFGAVVGNKAVQVGQYVQPGTRLLALVPLDTVYVEAN